MVMIGKNVKAGVIGGVTPELDDEATAAYQAGDSNAKTVAQVTGGDVRRDEDPLLCRAHAGRCSRHPAKTAAGD
jgi:hypothetical protein